MRLLRCCLVLAAASAAALGGAGLLLSSAAGPGPATFAGLLTRCCAWVALGCVAWGWLVTTLTIIEAAVLAERAPATRTGLPAGLRRLVLAGCGVALAAGAAPALAAGDDASQGMPPLVAGLPFPARPTDLPATTGHTVVVRPGDSLWAITASHLPADASDAAVCAGWHRLYERNRAVVGDDPSLIRPGQQLALPDDLEEQS